MKFITFNGLSGDDLYVLDICPTSKNMFVLLMDILYDDTLPNVFKLYNLCILREKRL